MKDRLELFKRYAQRSYDNVVASASYYKKMIADATSMLENCRVVADIGCGTGNLTVELAKKGISVIASDENPVMIEKTRQKIARLGLEDRVELRNVPVEQLRLKQGSFDGVAMLNVLYALDNPYVVLDKVYSALSLDGVFVATGPKPDANNDLLNQQLLSELDLTSSELQEDISVVQEVNASLVADRTHFLTTDRLTDILIKYVGFSNILKTDTTCQTFLDQGIFIAAKKAKDYSSMIQEVTYREAEIAELEDIFKFRYYVEHDKLGLIPDNSDLVEFDSFDPQSLHYVGELDGRYVAYHRNTGDSPLGLPVDEIADISAIRKNSSQLGQLCRWIAAPYLKGVGAQIAHYSFADARKRGFDYLITVLEPGLSRQYKIMGFSVDTLSQKNIPGFSEPGYIETIDVNNPPRFLQRGSMQKITG
jgi:ubiquinone/menaquinone biosynthesis C-methylase UbiE